MQEVERSWSNNNVSPKILSVMRKDSLTSIPRSNKSNYSIASMASYKTQRTKSLCVFYNSSIMNYAKSTMAQPKDRKTSTSSSNHKMQNNSIRDMKILQNHEKILEVQNKWTGNGKFIIKEKCSFLVST